MSRTRFLNKERRRKSMQTPHEKRTECLQEIGLAHSRRFAHVKEEGEQAEREREHPRQQTEDAKAVQALVVCGFAVNGWVGFEKFVCAGLVAVENQQNRLCGRGVGEEKQANECA